MKKTSKFTCTFENKKEQEKYDKRNVNTLCICHIYRRENPNAIDKRKCCSKYKSCNFSFGFKITNGSSGFSTYLTHVHT